ncbi:rod shape-determining protein RodA [bacterium]|nr:MAG: rod shape-determining protein RodA [bacterium]
MRRGLRQIDWVIATSVFLIVSLGLLVLYSSGIKAGEVKSEIDASRQFLYAGIGLLAGIVVARIDYRFFKSYAVVLYVLMVVSLAAVDFIGFSALGAQRWISIGFFQFQPSEFAKLALILVLAAYYSNVYSRSHQMRYFIYSIIILAVPMMLVVIQPDLGTGLVLFVIWLSMTLASRVKKRYLVAGAAAGAVSLPIVYSLLAPYQQNRIDVLLNPQADKLGTGYNVTQAIIAVGSGGWTGRGLSSGSQSQLNFLPSQHTDFIFAVLAEKLGFLGAALAIILYGILIIRIYILSTESMDRFGSFICIGTASMLLFHVLINIGMNMGIMPVTGIPLPLISAGGTSMLTNFLILGVVLSVARHRETKRRLKDESV